MKILKNIWKWLVDTALVARREFTLVFSDVGVLIFFFALPVIYPILYAAIYNPEVSREMPVAVVDHCRTAQSREFVRHADATEAIKICGYASNMGEARRWMEEHRCIAVLEIPAEYSAAIGRGEQGVIQFYSDATLLLRYRTFLQSLTDLQLATCADIRNNIIDNLGAEESLSSMAAVGTEAYFLGDTQQGFGSFIIPGIVVLILQQSMVLGICMLMGTSKDRRRRNAHGTDPRQIHGVAASATVVGRTLCYVMIYLPLSLYILHYIPVMFNFPHQGNMLTYMAFILPLLVATAMLGQALTCLVSERESAFVVVVFSSLVFLFLSGLTWPRYAMHPVLKAMSDLVPASWGIEGFININNNAAALWEVKTQYVCLWMLAAIWFAIAVGVTWLNNRRAAAMRKE